MAYGHGTGSACQLAVQEREGLFEQMDFSNEYIEHGMILPTSQ